MKVFWCNDCRIPIIDNLKCVCGNKTRYMATDIRPVFPEEKHLLYKITGEKIYINSHVWYAKGYNYFVNGNSIRIPLTQLVTRAQSSAIQEYINNQDLEEDYKFFNDNIERFIKINNKHLNDIDHAALDFIEKAVKFYPKSLPIVSFSGGKDSTVVSDLVVRALSNPSILHLFGDTTLELSHTYNYMERFRKQNSRTPFLISKSEHDFMDLCHKMGPPSRVMSWCCTVFKTGPLNTMINSFAKDKQILTFYGIRGQESVSRRDYQVVEFNDFDKIKTSEIDFSPKIAKQKVTSPIFEWRDIDVWLYILGNNLDFNDAYRLGFGRVGCWCCPNNSDWAMSLAKIFLPEQSDKWYQFLVSFAKGIGKEDAEEYVQSGNWKARQGGAGLVNKQINVEAKPCIDEEYARTFNLTKPITEELYEYFKPFGIVSKDLGRKLLNEVIVLDLKTNKPIIKLQGRLNTHTLKVITISANNYRLLSQRIDCQLRKYQSCIGCLGCISICPFNAISYVDGSYRIIQDKCKSCLKCIHPWRGGCLMTKVLAVKKGV